VPCHLHRDGVPHPRPLHVRIEGAPEIMERKPLDPGFPEGGFEGRLDTPDRPTLIRKHYCVPCSAAMPHTYTARNPNKRYRYYVCTKAQKQGWDSCPTKSLPAAEIERFVVERIRAIGKDPGLINETLKEAREQVNKRVKDLQDELRIIEQDLKRYNKEVRQLVSGSSRDSDSRPETNDRLADLQDRIRADEQRGTRTREEIIALGREIVDEKELASALATFDPVWDSLSPREQARVMHLLLERVGYDGDKGTVAMTFQPNGIKALAQERSMNEEGLKT